MSAPSARKASRCAMLFAVLAISAFAMIALSAVDAAALVDINTADQKTLETLPGVGPVMAQAIIAGRPYKSVDELAKVKGIGAAKLEKIKPLVSVGAGAAAAAPAAPAAAKAAAGKAAGAAKAAMPAPGSVNLNTASKAQLEALPGIGPKKADAIIAGRPYQKTEDVMKVKGIKQGIYDKIKTYITVQ